MVYCMADGIQQLTAYKLIIVTAGQSWDALLVRAEMLLWLEPRCDYTETVLF